MIQSEKVRTKQENNYQLQKRVTVGYYIEETKTESGKRVLPMTSDVEF